MGLNAVDSFTGDKQGLMELTSHSSMQLTTELVGRLNNCLVNYIAIWLTT